MKILNFKLSKRLNLLGLLDNIETEYVYQENYILKQFSRGERIKDFYNNGNLLIKNQKGDNIYNKFINLVPKGVYKGYVTFKTLTLEEAIEFIGKNMRLIDLISPNSGKWLINLRIDNVQFEGNSFLEAIEKMIEYLLDNNLLTNNK